MAARSRAQTRALRVFLTV